MPLVAPFSDDDNTIQPTKRNSDVWTPDQWPNPKADTRMDLSSDADEHYLMSLCQEKGQDLTKMSDYEHHSSEGKGAWIFVIDTGFDTDHGELQPTSERQIKKYVPDNIVALPKLTQQQRTDGWEEGDELINDKNTDNHHGTAVAGVAAGVEYGVASKANLYLLKEQAYMRNKRTGEIARVAGQLPLLVEIFDHIVDTVKNDPDIDPTKSVINLSWSKCFHPPCPANQSERTSNANSCTNRRPHNYG